jgi:ABC-type multidrug transport system fused ATPase/permease subunit
MEGLDLENFINVQNNNVFENSIRKEQLINVSDKLKGVNYRYRELIQELYLVAEEEERYNLKWAFANAQNKLQNSMENLINEYSMKQQKLQYDKNSNHEYLELESISKLAKEKAKWKIRMFKIASSMVTGVDLLISLILVLIISNISHTGEMQISSEILSFLFVLFFAFLKVTLEKYITGPAIERWGWKLYTKTINTYIDKMGDCAMCMKK